MTETPKSFVIPTTALQQVMLEPMIQSIEKGECVIAQCFGDGFRVTKITNEQARAVATVLGGDVSSETNSAFAAHAAALARAKGQPADPQNLDMLIEIEGDAAQIGHGIFQKIIFPMVEKFAKDAHPDDVIEVLQCIYAGAITSIAYASNNEIAKQLLTHTLENLDELIAEPGPTQ